VKFAILLIAALLAGTVECVTSCAAVTLESPCHHHQSSPHHQDPGACSHELVLDRVHAPAIDHGCEACGAVQTALPKNPHPDGWGWSAWLSDLRAGLRLPRPDAGSSLSLRI
jgi:hypothetical protein